jgi:hypothetical protein
MEVTAGSVWPQDFIIKGIHNTVADAISRLENDPSVS